MRLALPLSGTDLGRSGIGVYVRALLPRLAAQLASSDDALIAIGTARELAAYGDVLAEAEHRVVPRAADRPVVGAGWALALCAACARDAGADVLLLPAANRRACLRPSLPTVAVVHDLAQIHVPGKYDRLRTLYVTRVLPSALATATALVAVSEATRGDLARVLRCPRSRIDLIPNGVDAARFAPGNDQEGDARNRVRIDGPHLLYPARLEHPGKNHLRLLQAFAASRLRRTHTLVLTGADWGGERLIRAEIVRLGLGASTRLTGYVDEMELRHLIAAAGAVIAVGLCEGFGLPALEGLAAGRPVVAARTGALPEVVGDLGVLCDPYDPVDMTRALERVIDDPGLRVRVQREGPARARRRSWDLTCRQLLAVCRRAMRAA